MPFDEDLAHRVRQTLRGVDEIAEKKMFGGLAFLHNGHMCCGIVRNDLMVRVGQEAYEEALAQPHAREMDFTGRPMKGLVYVSGDGVESQAALRRWVQKGLRFTSTLPPKE